MLTSEFDVLVKVFNVMGKELSSKLFCMQTDLVQGMNDSESLFTTSNVTPFVLIKIFWRYEMIHNFTSIMVE